MDTLAVVLNAPERLQAQHARADRAGHDDVVVDIEWSGISTGTERLLWSGRMPPLPRHGLSAGPRLRVGRPRRRRRAGSGRRVGERVFVPGARCFGQVRGLFGGAAARLVVPGARVVPIGERLGEHGILLALAATAYHAIAGRRRAAGTDRRPWRPRPAARPADARRRRRAADRLGDATPARRRRRRLPGGRPRPTTPPRLPLHLRRQRRRRRCSTR